MDFPLCSAVEMRLPASSAAVEGAFHEDGVALQSRRCAVGLILSGVMSKGFEKEEEHNE